MPIHFLPTQAHQIEVIHLPARRLAPEGADWIEVAASPDGRFTLDGSVPVPRAEMPIYGDYRDAASAVEAGVAFAIKRGVRVLYVETEARGCGH